MEKRKRKRWKEQKGKRKKENNSSKRRKNTRTKYVKRKPNNIIYRTSAFIAYFYVGAWSRAHVLSQFINV
jgi:hypothetical protein